MVAFSSLLSILLTHDSAGNHYCPPIKDLPSWAYRPIKELQFSHVTLTDQSESCCLRAPINTISPNDSEQHCFAYPWLAYISHGGLTFLYLINPRYGGAAISPSPASSPAAEIVQDVKFSTSPRCKIFSTGLLHSICFIRYRTVNICAQCFLFLVSH